MSTTSSAAVLDLPAGKLPLLHKGEVTQGQLRQLEVHCTNFFALKNVAKEQHVTHAISCFRDYRITTWLDNDDKREKVTALAYKPFMALVRERLLPNDWEPTLKQEMHARRQRKDETFLVFLTAVERLNSLLINTSSHLDDAHVCTLLEQHMLTDLADDIADEGKATDDIRKMSQRHIPAVKYAAQNDMYSWYSMA